MESNPLQNYFNNTHKITSFRLKKKLFDFNFKERRCEICKIDKWLGKPAPLELHHINGNNSDNSLDNLQIACPNCHAQTDNYRASNQERRTIKKSEEEIIEAIKNSFNTREALIKLGHVPQGSNYKRIGDVRRKHNLSFKAKEKKESEIKPLRKRKPDGEEKISIKSRVTISLRTPEECHIEYRKVEWPKKMELLALMWREPLTSIAKRYGVSDNAIRKWAKHYKIPYPPRGYWIKLKHGHDVECLEIKKNLFIQFGIEW